MRVCGGNWLAAQSILGVPYPTFLARLVVGADVSVFYWDSARGRKCLESDPQRTGTVIKVKSTGERRVQLRVSVIGKKWFLPENCDCVRH